MNKSNLRLSANALTCLLFLFSSHLFAQNCNGNLVANSGFEQGLAGWQLVTGNVGISSDASSGSSAVEFGGNAGSHIINQVFQAKPNTFYSVRAFIKENNTDAFVPQVKIRYFSSTFQPLSSLTTDVRSTSYTSVITGRRSPSNTAFVAIELEYNTNSNTSRLLIDDVCFLEEPNNSNCSISAQAVNLVCDDNGTSVNQLDDTFTFDLLVSGSNNSSGWRTIKSNFFFADGSYNTATGIETLRISDGPRDYTITDFGNENCRTTLTVNPPATCSNSGSGCEVDLTVQEPFCNNNGTPDNPLDDTYSFNVRVTGTNTGGIWESTGTGEIAGFSGNYNTFINIGPFDIYNSQVNFFGVRDRDSNSPCFDSKDINNPLACSNSNPNVCPGSMLQNGNFSNGLNGWQRFPSNSNLATITSNGAFGQGVQICNDAQNGINQSYLFQEFQVTPGPGKEGLVTWNYQRVSGGGSAQVRLFFEDAAGNQLFGQSLNPGFQDDWNSNSFSRNIPDNATKVIISYGMNQGAPTSTGCVIFDELCFQILGGTTPTCSISATNIDISACDDRNTSDPSDDLYDWLVDVSATNGGSDYIAEWVENGGTRRFDRTYPVGIASRFNRISNGPFTLTLTDKSDPNCTTSVQIVPPAPCSTGGGTGGDLELTATGTPATVPIYANATTTFTLTNTGSSTSSNIEVDFTLDAGSILRGGNEFDASQGTLQSFWTATPVWQVGSLAPGQSATIDLNLFTRTADAITVYGQVSQANGADPDSTPGNGTCCTANEDDEAAFTFNGSNPPPPPPSGTDLRVENVRLRNTPPTIIGQGVSAFFDGIVDGTPLSNNQFPITYSLFLSTDNSLSANDTRVLDLGLGFGAGLQFGGQVPTNLAPGNYYLIVEIDSPNNISETNENNNWTASASPISIISDPTTNLPDLTFGALFINNAPSAGEVLNYNFNLVNAGTALAAGSYTIRAYISTDNTLSSDDIQDGVVPTGNTPVGTINSVPGASTLPSNLPQGDYFLILEVDADNQITESNEGNNTIAQPFTSQPTTGGSSCAFITNYTPSGFDPLSTSYDYTVSENGAGYTINYASAGSTFSGFGENTVGTYQLDLGGNVTNSNETTTPKTNEVVVETTGLNLELVFNNTGVRRTINYGTVPAGAQALGGGAVFRTASGFAFGIFIVDATGNAIDRVVQTDNAGNLLRVDEMPTRGFYQGFGRLTEGPDGSLFAWYTTSGNNTLFGIPANGTPWDFRVLSDTPSADWEDTRVSTDGRTVITSKRDNFRSIYAVIDVQTGTAQEVDLNAFINAGAPPNGFRRGWMWGALPTSDGGVLVSTSFSNVIGMDQGLHIGKLDANGQTVWRQEFPTTNFTTSLSLKPIAETADGGYLFAGREDNAETVFIKTTNTGALTPLCSGGNPPPPPPTSGSDLELSFTSLTNSPAQWSSFPVMLTLSNTGTETVTDINVRFNRADEVVYQGGNEFNVSQGTFQHFGDEIWRVGTLNAGETAILEVNYFRLSANGFTAFAEIQSTSSNDVDSTPGNGTCCTANEDDEASLQIGSSFGGSVNNRSSIAENLGNEAFAILNAFPNPVTDRFNVEVYSNETQTTELTVVNILGQPVFQQVVALEKGHNTIPIALEDGVSGMMTVKMTPFHPYLRQIRVMKVRD